MYQEMALYDKLVRKLGHITLKLRGHMAENQDLEARLRVTEERDHPAASATFWRRCPCHGRNQMGPMLVTIWLTGNFAASGALRQ